MSMVASNVGCPTLVITQSVSVYLEGRGYANGVPISMVGLRLRTERHMTSRQSKPKTWTPCRHALDSSFPKELVGVWEVGLCRRCKCLVAVAAGLKDLARKVA